MNKLKKKERNKEETNKEDTVLVYRCQCLCSVHSVAHVKLKELTHLLNCRRLLEDVSCHHRFSSFVPPAISIKRSPNFLASSCTQSVKVIREMIGCVVLSVHPTRGSAKCVLLQEYLSTSNVVVSGFLDDFQCVFLHRFLRRLPYYDHLRLSSCSWE